MALTNAPVEFAQSMVSFERVFEVLDMPIEIQERPSAKVLPAVQGHIQFEDVSFDYKAGGLGGLTEVTRFSRGSVQLKAGQTAREWFRQEDAEEAEECC